jgi:CBS domain-containing protein
VGHPLTNQEHTMTTAAVPFAKALAGDAMHEGIVTIGADATVAEVAGAMARARIHCVVVAGIAQHGVSERLAWGVLSDLDLMAALASGDTRVRAASLAATATVTVETGEPLLEAARIMAEEQVSHLVVVEPTTDRPVGVVSTLDVARAAAEG